MGRRSHPCRKKGDERGAEHTRKNLKLSNACRAATDRERQVNAQYDPPNRVGRAAAKAARRKKQAEESAEEE